MVVFIRSDLEFILQQILYAQAGGTDGTNLINVLPNVQVPWGLRTVSGEFNNLIFGQDEFGAADNTFPRMLDPVFRTADVGTYSQKSGFVFDSQPRIISNLIVDQTPDNPAAVAAAGRLALLGPGLP